MLVIGSVAGDPAAIQFHLWRDQKEGSLDLLKGMPISCARWAARAVLIKPGFVDTPMTAGSRTRGCYGLSRSKWRA